jgi:hypothetical protein
MRSSRSKGSIASRRPRSWGGSKRDEAEREQVDRDDGGASGAHRRDPHAIDEAEGRDRRQIKPGQARSVKASSNNARVNSQNTTTLPVDSAINGACQIEAGDVAPIADVAACAADPSANAIASRPPTVRLKSRWSETARTSSKATLAARNASSTVASGIRSSRSRNYRS